MSFEFTAAEGPVDYDLLAAQLTALLGDETDLIANAANASALLYHALGDVNWVGFYFVKGEELVVGPFQGLPACVRIARGKGVCGTAWESGETQRVADVDAFPGHIPCDSASRSEVVVPLKKAGDVVAVLDIDSPKLNRFNEGRSGRY